MIIERINLVPQKPLAERLKNITPIILLAVTAVILSLVYLENQRLVAKKSRIDREIHRIESTAEEAAILLASKQTLVRDIDLLQKQQGELDTKITKLEKIHSRKKFISQALAGIAGAIPPSIKCDKISFQGNNGEIRGSALAYDDLPALVKKLKENPLFREVSLQGIDRVEGEARKGLDFQILLTLN